MPQQFETDFPAGHPARADYNPASPEAREYARLYVHPLGERDFPVDHPKATDTPGNLNERPVIAGVDPLNSHLEAFTGRTPAQAEAVRGLSAAASAAAQESPVMPTVDIAEVAGVMNARRRALKREVLTEDEVREILAGLYREDAGG